MRVLLKSAKLMAVLLALSWAAFAIYLGSISNYARIQVSDAYVHVQGPIAKSARAYMVITNETETDDRLIGVQAEIARSAVLHRFENGIMRLAADGFDLPAGGKAVLQPQNQYVMLLGLSGSLNSGESVTMTLRFEKAGELVIRIPVK